MTRSRMQTVRLRLNRGLHEQPNYADLDYVRDCKNVWAPNGDPEQRPGLQRLKNGMRLWKNAFLTTAQRAAIDASLCDLCITDIGGTKLAVSGTMPLDLSGLAVGDAIYFGIARDSLLASAGSLMLGQSYSVYLSTPVTVSYTHLTLPTKRIV